MVDQPSGNRQLLAAFVVWFALNFAEPWSINKEVAADRVAAAKGEEA